MRFNYISAVRGASPASLSVTAAIISDSKSKIKLHTQEEITMSNVDAVFSDLKFEQHLAKLAQKKAEYDAAKKAKEVK